MNIMRTLKKHYHTHVTIYKQKNSFSDNNINPEQSVPENLIPLDDRDAGGLPFRLQLSIGTRVMLLRNLNTQY